MINLHNTHHHPLAVRFSDLAGELERLPPSIVQTALMVKLEELLQETQDLLNGKIDRQHDSDY